MSTPLPHSSSDIARLMADPPGFAVGWTEPLYLPDPAAGATWTHTVDGRYYERLVLVLFTLVTSAVVGNRFITVALLDANGKLIMEVPGSGAVVASSTVTVCLIRNAPSFAVATSGSSFGYLSDFLVPPGWQWTASINGEDAGDQVSNVRLIVQRFPNDATSIVAGQ